MIVARLSGKTDKASAGMGVAGRASQDVDNSREKIVMTFPLKAFSRSGAFGALVLATAALAQGQPDQMAIAYQSGRNQLGILGYCVEKGHVGADIVEVQRRMLGLIPAPTDKSAGDAAEARGKKGTIAMMGVTQDLETIAKAQGGTAATYCKQIGDVVKQAGAALPK
jgi:hypothetical protein